MFFLVNLAWFMKYSTTTMDYGHEHERSFNDFWKILVSVSTPSVRKYWFLP
jgi:hypothetical protein